MGFELGTGFPKSPVPDSEKDFRHALAVRHANGFTMKKDWSHVGSVDELTRTLAAAEAEARIREVLLFQSAIETVAEKCADEEMAVGLPFYSLVKFTRGRLATLRAELEKNSDRANG